MPPEEQLGEPGFVRKMKKAKPLTEFPRSEADATRLLTDEHETVLKDLGKKTRETDV